MTFVKRRAATLVVALVSALLGAACSSGGSGGGGGGYFDSLNAAPPDTGPGCYDHKNRLERTVTTAAECATLTWVWKP